MTFDLDQRTAALGVGDFAGFALGPRDATGTGAAGLWRAQLGTHWHQQLRAQAEAEFAAAAEFELPIVGRIVHRGWCVTLTGRIDQRVRRADGVLLREVKSVIGPLPADEAALRADYPGYFVQLATYAALTRLGLAHPGPPEVADDPARKVLPPASDRVAGAELVFVEAGSGLVQIVRLNPADDAIFRGQLERLVDFLDLRLKARLRLRGLRFRPAFAAPRPGQETTRAELTTLFQRRPLVLFEAPTGFGKTGVLLEFALEQLRSGHFDRAVYLTSKSTGQIQVVQTLATMTGDAPTAAGTPVAAWHVRNKGEHCINHTFHCVREVCPHLVDAARRWSAGGLARFYLDERHARDLETLRAAGRAAGVCPYEITRVALAFNDLWIGDYNYVFAPRNRTLFFDQPGFTPARTLLLVDEAHNLPSRVADAYSHAFSAAAASETRDELHRLRASSGLLSAWDHWCHFLRQLRANDGLSAVDEDDALHLLDEIARRVPHAALDFAALSPAAAETLWQVPAVVDDIAGNPNSKEAPPRLPRLWWSPREGELALTCLDAGAAIGATLREFGGVVLASATLQPVDGFASACGLDLAPDIPPPPPTPAPTRLGALNKRETRSLYRQLTSAAELLRVEQARDASAPVLLRALTPWRDGTYEIAFDTRIDTTFQHRSRHYTTTATTVSRLHRAARGAVAVFFPSYAYAEAIQQEAAAAAPGLRVAVQPKLRDLTAQSNWVEDALKNADALFLVLGSSFAEGIDSLGGRVSHAMVVAPALPEVNAVQRARLAEAGRAGLSRDEAFRRVYQVPGMTKVNQALGRLVRAPGQHARVLLHCRRFSAPGYCDLLAPEYRIGPPISNEAALDEWLTPSGG